jgi:CheY-like chemotaxis protein
VSWIRSGLTNELFAINGKRVGALNGKTILVVDDEADIVDLLELALTAAGGEVVRAMSAREALEILPACRPDVFLLDIAMPEMDGYQLLSAIRSDPALRRVPAVAVTGCAYDADKQRAFAEGFAVHVAKPFKPQVLIDLVRWVSAKKPPRSIC